MNYQRALDSRRDLFTSAGVQDTIPNITLPLGAASYADDAPIPEGFRAIVIEPCDRISIYLATTKSPLTKPNATPAAMFLQVRLGIECAEETLISFTFQPTTLADAGHLVTFATEQLWSSMVIVGHTLGGAVPVQRVGLIIELDKAGMCCADNPVYGPLVVPS